MLKGVRGEVPTIYEFIMTVHSGSTCSDGTIDIGIKTNGKVTKGEGDSDYLMNVEHVYYRLSEFFSNSLGCTSYHQPNQYFDLMTSQCPALQEDKNGYQLNDTWYVNTIDFYDTYLQQDGVVMNLVDSSSCIDPVAPTLTPVPAPSEDNNNMIVIIVIVIIIIVILSLCLVLVSIY